MRLPKTVLAAVLLLATSGVFPAVSAQDSSEEPYTVVMLPPYTRSATGGDLVVVAVADHHAGFLAVSGANVDAVDENGVRGSARVEMDHVLREDASFIDYEIALDRTVAWDYRGHVAMGARASSSDGLQAGASAPPLQGPTVLSFRLQNPDGVVEAGTITVGVWVSAYLRGCGPPFPFLPCSVGAMVAEATVRSNTATVHPASPS